MFYNSVMSRTALLSVAEYPPFTHRGHLSIQENHRVPPHRASENPELADVCSFLIFHHALQLHIETDHHKQLTTR